MHLSPSLLAADSTRLADAVRAVEAARARFPQIQSFHVDVMDGHYVANLAFSPQVIHDLRGLTNLPLHAHLEVERPERFIPLFAHADLVIVQADACADVAATVAQILRLGPRAGVAINPGDDPVRVVSVLANIDLLLAMTVAPGFGGQPFDRRGLDVVRWAAERRAAGAGNFAIGVDGGVSAETIGEAVRAGADFFVAGTAIFGGEVVENVEKLVGVEVS